MGGQSVQIQCPGASTSLSQLWQHVRNQALAGGLLPFNPIALLGDHSSQIWPAAFMVRLEHAEGKVRHCNMAPCRLLYAVLAKR